MDASRNLKLLGEAYLNLLMLDYPHRGKVQHALCDCRDEIARMTGTSSEHVQNSFELVALVQKASR